jgi:hypothetical protein
MVQFLFLISRNIGFCIDTFDKKLRLFFGYSLFIYFNFERYGV